MSYKSLKSAALHCKACGLYKNATQTVFGEGPVSAPIMVVGEQPGNKEDIEGKPFVGPSGALLHKALVRAGIDLKKVYVTNAVKHFKFLRAGKIRLHQKPNVGEIRACRPWLEAEIRLVKPKVIVCMGATAARSLLGPKARVQRDRGKSLRTEWAPAVVVTEHPAAILRTPERGARDKRFEAFARDLAIARALASPGKRLPVPEVPARRPAVGQGRRPHDDVGAFGD